MILYRDRIPTPIGQLTIVTDGRSLCAVDFEGDPERLGAYLRKRFGEATIEEVADPQGFSARFRAYFAGDLGALDDIPVETGGSEFQRSVWRALREIPAGGTVSYGELAKRIGKPNASRAVGLANGMNPVPIVLPCHRVIGANSSLTGYGGGLELQHEGALL
jgi:methylated-DNA-[protein]-cysteine S-methyltransferase